jgi:hypothetical protein
MPERNPRIACPVNGCTKAYANRGAVGGHMRKDHGIYGGLSGRERPDRVKGATRVATTELVLTPPDDDNGNAHSEFWRPEDLFLLTDGPDLYIVQKIPRR